MHYVALAAATLLACCFLNVSKADELDRAGVGDWCYAPVRTPSKADRISFIDEMSAAAVKAERKWDVPASILVGMTIVESGYGTTRIAIKSNNILAFKWPGDTLAAGHARFVLWCQPKRDKGNVYPAFKDRSEAIDFVASRLKRSQYYRAATEAYKNRIKKGEDRKVSAKKWLTTIAPLYNWRPKEYIKNVEGMADDPVGDGSRNLWSLEPQK